MNINYEQWVNSLENQIKSREQQRVKLMEAIQSLEKQLNTVVGYNRNLGQERDSLIQNLKVLQQKIGVLENQLRDNNRIISNYTILNRSANDSITQLKKQIGRLNNMITNSSKNDDTKVSLINKMIEDRDNKQKEHIEIVANFQRQLLTSKNQISQLSQLLADCTQKNNEKDAQLLKNKQQLNRLGNQLLAFKSMGSKKDENMSLLLKKLEDQQKRNRNLQVNLQERQNKNIGLINVNNKLDSMVKNFQIEKIQRQKVLKTLEQENVNLRECLQQKQKEIQKLIERLGKERENNMGSSSQLNKKISQLSKNVEQLESNLTNANSNHNLLKNELKNEKQKAAKRENDLKQQLLTYQQSYKSGESNLIKKIENLQNQKSNMQKQIDSLSKKIALDNQKFNKQSQLSNKKLQILDQYAISTNNFKKIIDEIKLSLIEKEAQIKALEQANSLLRQQSAKHLQSESQIRKQNNYLKNEMVEISRSKISKNYNSSILPKNLQRNGEIRGSNSKIITRRMSKQADN